MHKSSRYALSPSWILASGDNCSLRVDVIFRGHLKMFKLSNCAEICGQHKDLGKGRARV